MRPLRCWWFHRRRWTVLLPGVLPWLLDAVVWCPVCDRGGTRLEVLGVGARA